MLAIALALLLGYVAGSIPSGVIITSFAGATDPRGIGSGNIGATNVLRTGRKDLAALTLLADALKGTIAVVLAAHVLAAPFPAAPFLAAPFLAGPFEAGQGGVFSGLAAAAGAFLGHLFPVFLRFKGGKGVATFLGCLIGVAWPIALIFACVWLTVVAVTRFSSAGALVASALSPPALALFGQREAALLFSGLAILLWIKHGANIRRLADGSESKVGRKP